MLEHLKFGKAISCAMSGEEDMQYVRLIADDATLMRHLEPLIELLLREQSQFICSPDFDRHKNTLAEAFKSSYDLVNNQTKALVAFLRPHFDEVNLHTDFFLLIELVSLPFQDQLINANLLLFPGDRILWADYLQQEGTIAVQTGLSLSKPNFAILIPTDTVEDFHLIHFASKGLLPYQNQYLKDKILGARPYENSFHLTADVMQVSNAFIREYLSPEQADKTERADMLQKSLGYFKENERFDENDFCNQVLDTAVEPELFRQFRVSLGKEEEGPMQFEISKEAVQKQARIFKSVLKLDKNFHVYIHGDKRMIERGQDDQGRKFYKLYYDKEF